MGADTQPSPAPDTPKVQANGMHNNQKARENDGGRNERVARTPKGSRGHGLNAIKELKCGGQWDQQQSSFDDFVIGNEESNEGLRNRDQDQGHCCHPSGPNRHGGPRSPCPWRAGPNLLADTGGRCCRNPKWNHKRDTDDGHDHTVGSQFLGSEHAHEESDSTERPDFHSKMGAHGESDAQQRCSGVQDHNSRADGTGRPKSFECANTNNTKIMATRTMDVAQPHPATPSSGKPPFHKSTDS